MELNDIYDENRNLTGKLHRRGTPWKPGEYGVVVCVWVYDGRGHLLLTRRAREKSFAGTWENSGGAVKAGETSRQAIARELYEETGIQAEPEEFELLDSDRERNIFYDHYCLFRRIPLKSIVLQPGETDNVMWASFGKVDWMIRTGKMCRIIGHQFYRQERRCVCATCLSLAGKIWQGQGRFALAFFAVSGYNEKKRFSGVRRKRFCRT